MKRVRCVGYFAALILAVTVLSPVAPAQEAQRPNSAIAPVPRQDPWWLKRHENMNARVKQGNVDLLMIGDSITHGWEGSGKETWRKYYEKRNAVNLGIGGDQTQHVLWRLDHGNIEGISPKLAVLMIGTNNSGGSAPEETAEGVKAIVEKLRTKLPNTKILVLAIFPRGADNNNPLRQVNAKVNEKISKLADDAQEQSVAQVRECYLPCRGHFARILRAWPRTRCSCRANEETDCPCGNTGSCDNMVFFLDINEKFLGADGSLSKEIMPDLLHPNAKGYEIWAEAVEPTIAELMGEK